ncbi:DUF6106 family protein [Clostridium merdae]|uniref:DUF6106 family protein n=1 Tax=Clostridium merdae TaxID=1958780 RepID=UPI000A271707|nr:DUF6106 family protein [Clostridium merdae]
MDVFVEQLLQKKKGRKDYMIIGAASVFGLILLALCTQVPFLIPFLLLIVAGVFAGIYYVAASRNLEFEYSTTNGDFTVDQITNRSRRKRICGFDLKSVEEMGLYNASTLQNRTFASRLMVGVDDEGTDAWYFVVHLKDAGNTLVVFNPNERMLTAIKPFLPRQVSVNAYRGR